MCTELSAKEQETISRWKGGSLAAERLLRPKPVALGSVVVDPPLFQAPLLEYTNHFFRLLVRHFGGVGLTCTELVHARGLIECYERTGQLPEQLWGVDIEPGPLAIQLWESDLQWLKRGVAFVASQLRPSVIDLNFGCPSHRVAGHSGGGAALLKTPERIGELVAAAVESAGSIPVTVKIRLGWDPSTPVAARVAQVVEQAGAAGLCVHGRYATQRMGGKADWNAIAAVRPHLCRIPLIGNGDIATPQAAYRAFVHYSVDGVMIGRAALSKPWIFRDIAAYLAGKPIPAPPTLDQKREILLGYIDRLEESLAPRRALVLAQKYACRLVHEQVAATRVRLAISQARSLAELRRVVAQAFER
ncbi:MAG: tRNA-dihydrouridine synthase [Thermoguttaceae bacterium]|nr:tRNA-dihydrouridine synthase [Thermoguttaceae bacterium]MDW8079349.1 tRNA-dihydrouridine synthase [Thermoguttaceae bacterium]